VNGFRSIRAYAPAGVQTLAVGLVAEAFRDRGQPGLPAFDVVICADAAGPVLTDTGLPFCVDAPVERLAEADLVVVLPGAAVASEASPPLIAAIQAAHRRGAIVAGHGTGSFTLAAAGLLDGRRATTHWRLAPELAARYPAVIVEPDVLYVDEGQVITGAGAGAGLDLYLHLLRREHGTRTASSIARDILVPPHRDGGQAQYIEAPLPSDTADAGLATALDWAVANLGRPILVEEMAAQALMSVRTFARRFKATTGTTPHAWLLHQRLARAEEMLETTDLPVHEVARLVGYASGAVLREQFVKRRGVPPRQYRQAFGAHRLSPVGRSHRG
jgi:transcriptional regulator GlxA family with amidase domain